MIGGTLQCFVLVTCNALLSFHYFTSHVLNYCFAPLLLQSDTSDVRHNITLTALYAVSIPSSSRYLSSEVAYLERVKHT